jgi:phosphoserine phosphatase RsbU/P
LNEEALDILLVEDNPGDARLLRELLKEASSLRFNLQHVDRMAAAEAAMAAGGADVVLLDLSLPDAHGMETVGRMLRAAPDAAIIVLSGLDDETTALKAVQAGAQDYLVKGHVEGPLLGRAIRYARERKRLEVERAQLLESERQARELAETAVQGRDEVLRVVAHDLGNSLSAVLVTTRFLLRTVSEGGEGATTRRYVENIRSLAEQMQRLRQDLLDAALLEAGRLAMEMEEIEPATLVEESFDRYAPVAAEKGITLTRSMPERSLPIEADPARLLQVLANLLTNAVKFTPSQGRIDVGYELLDQAVRYFVSDNGNGIPADNLPHLFDRFWTTRKGNPSGAGLGLAIARGIVEGHSGEIWAESTAGEGSTFYFTIPLSGVGA